jgi:outer membrane protein assembly factor BamB
VIVAVAIAVPCALLSPLVNGEIKKSAPVVEGTCFETIEVNLHDVSALGIFSGAGPIYSSFVTLSDGTVVVGSRDNNVYFLDSTAVKKAMESRDVDVLPSAKAAVSAPTARNVPVASSEAETGTVRKKAVFKTEHGVTSTPALTPEGTVVLGSDDGNVYFLNPDGTKKVSFFTPAPVIGSPAIMSDGTVLIGSFDGNLYFLNPDGTRKASFPVGATTATPTILRDGTISVGSLNGNIYFLDSEGNQEGIFKTGGAVRSSPVQVDDNTLVVGSDDGYVYFLNPKDKKEFKTKDIVKFKTGAAVSAPATVLADKTIVIGSADTFIYFLRPDGTKIAQFKTGNAVLTKPTILNTGKGEEPLVVVGSVDGSVYFLNRHAELKAVYRTQGYIKSSPISIGDRAVVIASTEGYNGSVYFLQLSPGATHKEKRSIQVACRQK